MIGFSSLGAHWPALLNLPVDDDCSAALEHRIVRALAAAGAVAWEWNVGTGASNLSARNLSTGDAALSNLKYDPAGGFFALVHPADRDWLRTAAAAAARGETPYDFEFRMLRPNGDVEWVRLASGSPTSPIPTTGRPTARG